MFIFGSLDSELGIGLLIGSVVCFVLLVLCCCLAACCTGEEDRLPTTYYPTTTTVSTTGGGTGYPSYYIITTVGSTYGGSASSPSYYPAVRDSSGCVTIYYPNYQPRVAGTHSSPPSRGTAPGASPSTSQRAYIQMTPRHFQLGTTMVAADSTAPSPTGSQWTRRLWQTQTMFREFLK